MIVPFDLKELYDSLADNSENPADIKSSELMALIERVGRAEVINFNMMGAYQKLTDELRVSAARVTELEAPTLFDLK